MWIKLTQPDGPVAYFNTAQLVRIKRDGDVTEVETDREKWFVKESPEEIFAQMCSLSASRTIDSLCYPA